ncbi:MAG: tetratricopeptide repeat protein [Pseudomonadota bacterium]
MPVTMTAQQLFEAGMILFTNGKYQNSIHLFTEALILDPEYEPAYLSRGSAFMREARMPEAIADFTNAIALNPHRERTFNLRGLARANLGDYEKAVSDYTRAIQINPEFSAAYVNRENAVCELQRTGHRSAGMPQAAETARHSAAVFHPLHLPWQTKRP